MINIPEENIKVIRQIAKEEVANELMMIDNKKDIPYVIELKLSDGSTHNADIAGDVIAKKLKAIYISIDNKDYIIARYGIAINPNAIVSWKFISKGEKNEN